MLPKIYEYFGDPLLIEVKDGQWNAFALGPVPSRRDLWLMSLLHEMGGINESVPDGTHLFTANRIAGDSIKTELIVSEPKE